MILVVGTATVQAQPVPRITGIWPQWVQRGAASLVMVEGENLGLASGFLFSPGDGITASRDAAPITEAGFEASQGGIVSADTDEKSLRVRIEVAPGVALGPREMRVVTPEGVSPPVTVNVGFLREVTEDPGAGSSNRIQFLELPVAVNGRITNPAEIDTYRFKARKGERLIFDVVAFRSGSSLDSSLAVLDAGGRELVRSEDVNGLDSLIDLTVPSDGEYQLAIRDFRYQGGKDYGYRIVAGELPYLDSVFPFGGQRGQAVEISLAGRNLGGLSRMKLRIETNAPLGQQEIRARTDRGHSNPVLFAVGENAEIFETEPNHALTNANAITVPATVNGRIGAAKDVDQFRFSVNKDQTLIIELLASRFGSPLDGVLTLTDKDGKLIQENDDAVGADARIERTFSEAGDYFVRIRDVLNRGGEGFGYRLVVRPPRPDFSTAFSPDTIRIHRGGHALINVDVQRSEGFGGPLEIRPDRLPAGVTAETLVIPSDSGVNPVIVLTAGESAPLGHHPLGLMAAGMIDGERVEHQSRPQADGRAVREAFLMILDQAAFSLDPLTVAARLDQNQSTTLECRVRRRSGFSGEVQVTAEGFSAGREPLTRNVELEPVTLKADEGRARLNLKARPGSETGTRLIVFKGEASLSGQKSVQYSRPIPLTIEAIPFTLVSSLPRLAITAPQPQSKSAANEAEFTVRADRRGWFADDISLRVEGLPEGIQINTTNISRGLGEAGFKLTATEKATVGKEVSLTVVGTASVNGRGFEYRTPSIAVTVNAPEGTVIPAPASTPSQ